MTPTALVMMITGEDTHRLLDKSLRSLERVGSRWSIIVHSAHTAATEETIAGLTPEFAEQVEVVPLRIPSMPGEVVPPKYSDFGSREFMLVNGHKPDLILSALERHERAIYCDVDICFAQNVDRVMDRILDHYPVLASGTGRGMFPPQICAGLIGFRRDPEALDLITRWRDSIQEDRELPGGPVHHDQRLINELLRDDPALSRRIYPLPMVAFPTGGLSMLYADEVVLPSQHGDFRFKGREFATLHANCVVGLEQKVALLEHFGF